MDHNSPRPSALSLAANPAGDVLFHSILVLHGSPAARSQLRRVVYYEFRPAEVEQAHGPHVPQYIPTKQKVLLACLRHRAERAFKVKVGKNLLADLPRRRAGLEDGGVWLLAFSDEGLRPARVVVHHDRAERVPEHPRSKKEREVHMGAAHES